MRRYVLFLVLLFIIIGVALIFQRINYKIPAASVSKSFSLSTRIEHSSHLFDPAFFSQADDKGQQYKKTVNERVFGGIIPHHLLAAPLIAGFFEGIANQKITTVILLSPNHYGVGPYNITSSKGIWTTIFGDLETDVSKVSQLESDKAAFVSEDLFDTEHGIYGIAPFIKKTFPDSKIVPIAINSGTSKEECDKLVQELNNIVDDQLLVIVSTDFSHYLPSNQADVFDKESIDAIESFNADKVFSLDHQKNIDSPESVYTLLKLMQLKEATKPIRVENTNSAKLTNQPDLQSTTSYLTMYFINQNNNLSTD